MTAPARRRTLLHLLSLVATLGPAAALMTGRRALAQQAAAPREIAITAQRFHYTPDEVSLKLGETVVLEVTALDFTHGFSIPELGVRADLIPGRAVRVTITPTRSGIVPFLCDNFCGDGHEQMSGRLLVSA